MKTYHSEALKRRVTIPESETELKRGDKVKTTSGKIETVLTVEDCRVITYESFAKGTWYHPTKVWRVK